MIEKAFISPCFETKINRAVFLHQDLVVYPDRDERLPDDIGNVIRFLFGKGVRLKEDIVNGYPSLILEGACYELRNVRTINADWTCQKVEQ